MNEWPSTMMISVVLELYDPGPDYKYAFFFSLSLVQLKLMAEDLSLGISTVLIIIGMRAWMFSEKKRKHEWTKYS